MLGSGNTTNIISALKTGAVEAKATGKPGPSHNKLSKENLFFHLSHEEQKAQVEAAYAELSKGPRWQYSSKTMSLSGMNKSKFQELSQHNLHKLKTELGRLTPEEEKFFAAVQGQTCELTHYSMAGESILNSREILSTKRLHDLVERCHLSDRPEAPLKDGEFVSNSQKGDLECFSESDFVFFRFEIAHQLTKESRFGHDQFTFPANTTALFQQGCVSLFNLWNPIEASVVRELKDEKGTVVRERTVTKGQYFVEPAKGFGFSYSGGKNHTLYVGDGCFFGPDIKPGIALAAIAELRRIGGDYQAKHLKDLTIAGLTNTISQLFRIEAKIPCAVSLNHSPYRYTAPLQMKIAIDGGELALMEKLRQRGMPLNEEILPGVTPFLYVFSNEEKFSQLLQFFHGKDNRMTTTSTTAGHVAAAHGNKTGLEFYLNNQGAIDAVDHEGMTIMQTALLYAQKKSIMFLLERGVEIDFRKDGFLGAVKAVERGDAELLEFFLNRGVPADFIPPNEDNLLLVAVNCGRLNCLQILLTRAPVLANTRGHLDGDTPLIYALKAIKKIIHPRYQPWAIKNCLAIIDALLDFMSDPTMKNNAGRNAIDIAKEFAEKPNNNKETFSQLRQRFEKIAGIPDSVRITKDTASDPLLGQVVQTDGKQSYSTFSCCCVL